MKEVGRLSNYLNLLVFLTKCACKMHLVMHLVDVKGCGSWFVTCCKGNVEVRSRLAFMGGKKLRLCVCVIHGHMACDFGQY